MDENRHWVMEFFYEYGWAILSAIIVILLLVLVFKPSNIVDENNKILANIQCYGEKLCESFADSNYSFYKDSLTGNNEMDIYCQKTINSYTTQQSTFHISDKNKFDSVGCENVTR